MSLPIPKYKIGDTVYTSHFTVEDVLCETCEQPTYADDDDDADDDWMSRRIIGVEKQVVEGCSIQQGIYAVEDGIAYQLSKERWTKDEESIYSTAEEARKVVEDELQVIKDRRAQRRAESK